MTLIGNIYFYCSLQYTYMPIHLPKPHMPFICNTEYNNFHNNQSPRATQQIEINRSIVYFPGIPSLIDVCFFMICIQVYIHIEAIV